jgi:hypothetical protein
VITFRHRCRVCDRGWLLFTRGLPDRACVFCGERLISVRRGA